MRLIDADAVFPWYVSNFKDMEPSDVRFSMNDIKGNLDNIPTGWIPVSERLPEVTETITDGDFDDWYTVYESSGVLVFGTCEGGREKRIHTANYNEWIHEDGRKECEWRDNLSGDTEINVIAWMPLPEPYKESEEE